MTLIEECKCDDGCQFQVTGLLERIGLTDEQVDEILTGEVQGTPEAVVEAIYEAERHTDAYYIGLIVVDVISRLKRSEKLDLLLCIELGTDPYKHLCFVDKVESLFTETSQYGDKTRVAPAVRYALRGAICVSLCFH